MSPEVREVLVHVDGHVLQVGATRTTPMQLTRHEGDRHVVAEGGQRLVPDVEDHLRSGRLAQLVRDLLDSGEHGQVAVAGFESAPGPEVIPARAASA